MYLLAAPFLAIAVYYLLQVVATTTATPVLVVMAFATGLISDTIVSGITRFAESALAKVSPDQKTETTTQTVIVETLAHAGSAAAQTTTVKPASPTPEAQAAAVAEGTALNAVAAPGRNAEKPESQPPRRDENGADGVRVAEDSAARSIDDAVEEIVKKIEIGQNGNLPTPEPRAATHRPSVAMFDAALDGVERGEKPEDTAN
jgi:hypothetical protein